MSLVHPHDHYDDSIEEDMTVLPDDMLRDALARTLRYNARLTRRVEDVIDWFNSEMENEYVLNDPIEWQRLKSEAGYRG